MRRGCHRVLSDTFRKKIAAFNAHPHSSLTLAAPDAAVRVAVLQKHIQRDMGTHVVARCRSKENTEVGRTNVTQKQIHKNNFKYL